MERIKGRNLAVLRCETPTEFKFHSFIKGGGKLGYFTKPKSNDQ